MNKIIEKTIVLIIVASILFTIYGLWFIKPETKEAYDYLKCMGTALFVCILLAIINETKPQP